VPHLTPIIRGIHATLYARITKEAEFQQLFEKRYAGVVFLCLPVPRELKGEDAVLLKDDNFGFRWFMTELLKHRPIWRDVLLASLVIQLMALATPIFTQIVIWVSNADAGFVQPDQKTRVKLAAYPFQKYGMLEGKVQRISADAQDKANDGAGTKPFQEAAYRALIHFDSSFLESRGTRLTLVPGMLVSAEIHLGRRSVLEYLLSPIQRIAHESGRER
jgi:hypothetical protein